MQNKFILKFLNCKIKFVQNIILIKAPFFKTQFINRKHTL